MLHDCYVETDGRLAELRVPSIVDEAQKAHRARLERLNLVACRIVEAPSVPVAPPTTIPEPVSEPIADAWVARQKRQWFAVVEDMGPIEPRPPLIEEIVRACVRYFQIPKREFLADRRLDRIVYARHVAMFLCKNLTARSLPEIGRKLGGRDHSTVLHGIRKITRLIKTDQFVAYDVAHVEAMLP